MALSLIKCDDFIQVVFVCLFQFLCPLEVPPSPQYLCSLEDLLLRLVKNAIYDDFFVHLSIFVHWRWLYSSWQRRPTAAAPFEGSSSILESPGADRDFNTIRATKPIYVR